MNHPHWGRHRVPTRQLILLTAALLGAGCASLDPDRELGIAANLAQRVISNTNPADLWALPVDGESPAWDGLEPLTYEAAAAVALQGDPALRAALAMIVERRAWYVQKGLPPNPTIGFGIGIAVDGLAGAPLMVQGLQMLSWLWKNPHRVDAAEAELRAAVYDAAARCVALTARARTQLAKVLASQQTVELDSQYAKTTHQSWSLVRALNEAGELALLDVDRAFLDNAEAIASLEDSRYKLQLAKLELLATMGRPTHTTHWSAQGALPPDWSIPSSESDLLDLASTGRLDVAAARERVHHVEADLGLAQTRRFPEVGVGLTYQRNFGGREGLVPSAAITIPILDNGDPAVAIQLARLERARMDLRTARLNAQHEVRTSANRYQDARVQARIIRDDQLSAAVAAQERSRAAYAEGEANLNTLLLTQQKRIAVERRLVQQKFATMNAMCDLRMAVGGNFDPTINAVPEFSIESRPDSNSSEDAS